MSDDAPQDPWASPVQPEQGHAGASAPGYAQAPGVPPLPPYPGHVPQPTAQPTPYAQPASYAQPTPYAQQGYAQPGAAYPQPQINGQPQWGGQPQWMGEPEKARSSVGLAGTIVGGLAIVVAAALGALSVPLGIAAVVLGIIGLTRKHEKKGLPLAALITGIVSFVVWIAILVVMLVMFTGAALDEGLFDGTDDSDVWTSDEDLVWDDTEPVGATGADGSPGLGSVESPIAAGTVFSWDSSWGDSEGTVWDVTIEGVVTLPEAELIEPGRCVAVVGSVTPTSIPDDNVYAYGDEVPPVGVIVDGESQYGWDTCDVSGLESAGYVYTWNVEAAVGESALFYYDVWIPEDVSGDIEAVVVGDVGYEGVAYVEAADVVK